MQPLTSVTKIDNVLIDDLREFNTDIEHVNLVSAFEAISFFSKFTEGLLVISNLYLDHDLGFDSDLNKFATIRDVCPILREMHADGRLVIETAHIITSSPVGRKWLELEFLNLAEHVHHVIKPLEIGLYYS